MEYLNTPRRSLVKLVVGWVLTYDISNSEISFLDITLYKGEGFITNNVLDIKSYTKPTETFQYLARDSAHPSYCFQSLIYGETIRHMRNNSSQSTFTETVNKFASKLKERGYTDNEIHSNINKVDFNNRSAHINKLVNKETAPPPLVCVSTYDPKWAHLKDILGKHWDIIDSNPDLKKVFPCPPTVAYRRGKNIGDIITSTKLEPD